MLTELSVADLKWIAVLVISFGSFTFGVLPNILGLGNKMQNSIILSSILCFGGGVLFATSVLNILPNIRKDLSGRSEIVFCAGYLLIYLVDVIVASLSGDNNGERTHLNSEQVRTYGTNEDNTPIKSDQTQNSNVISSNRLKCLQLGLLLSFSLHSLLEGLVIGTESTQAEVVMLLTAMSCHKFVVAFCLGAELSDGGRPLYAILPDLSVFVGGSAVGIALGIVLNPHEMPLFGKIAPVLQGLAGGTLLYVVVTEILPRERSKKLPKYSAVAQYIALCCGFVLMAFVFTDN